MENNANPIMINEQNRYGQIRELLNKMPRFYWVASILIFGGIWKLLFIYVGDSLLLPDPLVAAQALFRSITDPVVLNNLTITMRRVVIGLSYAIMVALPLGYMMGYSKTCMRLLDPLVSSLRQIPIMAWVPLTITWFGLGDGPTIFLIGFSGVFPIIINTIAGVQAISNDYHNAARSMGAGTVSILVHVIFPGSLPDILTGVRIALSSGWMSVICAEFIATTSGFGYSMVAAQAQLKTDEIIALMIIAAMVGYILDRALLLINRVLAPWKYVQ